MLHNQFSVAPWYGFMLIYGGRIPASNLPMRTLFSIFADIGGQRVGVCLRKSQRIWRADGVPSLHSLPLPQHQSVCLYMYLSLSQQMDPGKYWDAANLLLYMLDCRRTQTHTNIYILRILICFGRTYQLRAFLPKCCMCRSIFLVELYKTRASQVLPSSLICSEC